MGTRCMLQVPFVLLTLASFAGCSSSPGVAPVPDGGRDGAGDMVVLPDLAPDGTTDATTGKDGAADAPPGSGDDARDSVAAPDAGPDGIAGPDRPAETTVAADARADTIAVDAVRDGGRDPAADASPGKDVIAPTETMTSPDAGDGAGDTGGAGGEVGGAIAPTFAVEMTKADQALFYSRASNGGSSTFGVANPAAGDDHVAELVFQGNAALGPSDKLSPEFATEIGTTDDTFHYGTYRARVQLARCAANEELVNGIFTYFNDGKDHDGDGLVDNSEIDIEILCSDPSIISLTIWSEYTSDTAKKSVTRVIRTKTGAYEDYTNDETVLGSGTRAEFKIAAFPDPEAFYEMGFEWHADRIRYFMVLGGVEVTLWSFTDASYVPKLPAAFLFNVWHSSDWWNGAGTADYPAGDAVMRVDWFRYWQE